MSSGKTAIRRLTLKACDQATGTAVVIDVLRAFTTAAYAFAAGAARIFLVADVEDAFAMKAENPDLLLLGETDGLPIAGFDFSNSPSELIGQALSGASLVQRTSAGTQGVVKTRRAKRLLVTGLCNASATATCLEQFPNGELSFVETGVRETGGGEEDRLCGDLLEALVTNTPTDKERIIRGVRQARASRKFQDPSLPAFPFADLECALEIDRFDFAMEVSRVDGRHVLNKVVL